MQRTSQFDRAVDRLAGLLLASGALALISFFFIGLDPVLLDVLIAANIAISAVMFMVTFFVAHPLQISAFPTVILLTTLFRLALNVGTTKSILLEGDAGDIVRSFGEFVVGSDYVVGAAIFLALVVIQFVVISKGGERVAIVSTRFTLDAMPGKQATIDLDLNSGVITKEEAKLRRRALEKESRFYGSIEGAMKFVQGDAIAGLVLCVINFVFGLVVGTMRDGLSATEAAEMYTILTIGDGLQAQIPSLMMSLAAGILVTRVSDEEDLHTDLGRDLFRQVISSRRVFMMTALFCVFLGSSDRFLGTGMPEVPFYALACAAGVLACCIGARRDDAPYGVNHATAKDDAMRGSGFSGHNPLLSFDIQLEFGAESAKIARMQTASGVSPARKMLISVMSRIDQELGVRFPPSDVSVDVDIPDPLGWRLRIREVVIASGRYDDSKALVPVDPAALFDVVPGASLTRLSWTGLSGVFVPEDQLEILDRKGLPSILAPALLEKSIERVLRRNARRFLGIQEVEDQLEELRITHAELVEAVVPDRLSLAEVADVLGELLDDGIPIRDLRSILEALARCPLEPRSVILFAEFVRSYLAATVVESRVGPDDVLRAIRLDQEMETTLLDNASGLHYVSDAERVDLISFIESALGSTRVTPDRIVVLVQTPQLRGVLATEIKRTFPDLLVVPGGWVPPHVTIEYLDAKLDRVEGPKDLAMSNGVRGSSSDPRSHAAASPSGILGSRS